jgi:hypothetical protein
MTSREGILHSDATARNLGFLRIWVFTAWFADIAKDPITDLATLPIDLMTPVGVLRLAPLSFWERVCTADNLQVAYVLMLLCLAATALGIRPYRPIAIFTCLLLTLYQGLILSFTYLSHSTLAALPVAYVLALFPAGDALALRRGPAREGKRETAVLAMVTATLALCITYACIGARRFQTGGLEIFLDGSMLNYVARNSASGGLLEGGYGLAALEYPLLSAVLVIGFPFVTVFELLSPLCLFYKWFRWSWLVVILLFHVLTWYLMQLLFVHNILLIAVLILRIDRLANWSPKPLFRRQPR